MLFRSVVLFQTHGGWTGHTLKDMKELISGNVRSEYAVQFDSTGGDVLVTDIADIEKWIREL